MNVEPRTVALVLGAAIVLTACSEGSPAPVAGPSSPPVTTPTPQVSEPAPPNTRCPNMPDVVSSGERVGGELTGDVDGDGSDDVVYVVRDDEGPAGCQTFVVAETAVGRLSSPAEEPDVSYSLQAPRINSLVEVDDSPGAEILVDLEQGAATQFLGMFTVVGKKMERVRIGGAPAYGNLFPYGGSVGHIEASNCTKEGGAELLIAMATPNATDYTIRTVLYDMRGSTLQPLPLDEQPPVATGTDVEASEGFDSSPFGACSS